MRTLVCLVVLAALALSGCGGPPEASKAGTSATPPPPTQGPSKGG